MSDPATEVGEDRVVALLSEMLAQADRTPLAERLASTLTRAIQDGTLPTGTALPREPELAQRLGLSRQTVGRALSDLARRGLVVRRRGIGTFVAAPAIEQPLGRLSSLIHTLTVDGRPPSSRLIGVRLTIEESIAAQLGADPATPIWETVRLFSVDDEPFALEWIYLHAACGQRLPLDRLADGVIDELLRVYCGLTIDQGEEILSLTMLDRQAAAFLHQSPGAAAFQIVRTASTGETVVEIRRRLVRGDRARFRLSLTGADPASAPMSLTMDTDA